MRTKFRYGRTISTIGEESWIVQKRRGQRAWGEHDNVRSEAEAIRVIEKYHAWEAREIDWKEVE